MLNHKLRDSKDEVKVSALAMLKERCRDPNVLNDTKDYTLHTYLDSKKMGQPLLVCIHKVMPIFFDTLEEMKAHWQPCLSLNLVAKPTTAQGVGKDRVPTVDVDIGKAGTSAQADQVDN